MRKMNVTTNSGSINQVVIGAGKPTMPLSGRQPMIERKMYDPSSASPRGERYPIPSFFEYRIKPREYDPL